MGHVLHVIVQPIEALLGVFCLVSAFLLYPDEDKRIQNSFEDLWVEVDDYQKLALSKHAAFMTRVAKFETRLFDAVFGHRLISAQALAVSFFVSYIGETLYGAVRSIYDYRHGDEFWRFYAVGNLRHDLESLLLLLAISVAIVIVRKSQDWRWTVVVLSILLVLVRDFQTDPTASAYYALWIIITCAGIAGGFACDVAFIAVTRQLLRMAGETTSTVRILATVLFNLILAALLVSPLFVVKLQTISTAKEALKQEALTIFRVIAMTNVLDAAIAFLFVALALLLLIHRCIWPILTRSLFRMQEIGIQGRRGILFAAGLALLVAGFHIEKLELPEWVKAIVEAAKG
jgi:hypothetical protein